MTDCTHCSVASPIASPLRWSLVAPFTLELFSHFSYSRGCKNSGLLRLMCPPNDHTQMAKQCHLKVARAPFYVPPTECFELRFCELLQYRSNMVACTIVARRIPIFGLHFNSHRFTYLCPICHTRNAVAEAKSAKRLVSAPPHHSFKCNIHFVHSFKCTTQFPATRT